MELFEAASPPWIVTGERSGLPTLIAAMESGSLFSSVSSMTRWCNNWNVLHLRFAHFQRVIDSANSQNVLAGMNFIKVILSIGSCHCLANTPQRLIRLHLEKRDSDSDKRTRKTDDTSSQVSSTQYRGGHYEHFDEQNETQKLVAHQEINDSMLPTGGPEMQLQNGLPVVKGCAGRFHASATFTITIVFEHSAHSTLRNPPLSYRVHVGEFEWQFECT